MGIVSLSLSERLHDILSLWPDLIRPSAGVAMCRDLPRDTIGNQVLRFEALISERRLKNRHSTPRDASYNS